MQAFGQYAADGTASALKRRDHKDATDLIVERERERERVVSALTSSIQNGADVRNAQAGHLIVEPTSGEASE
jgi:hypothetical protein